MDEKNEENKEMAELDGCSQGKNMFENCFFL